MSPGQTARREFAGAAALLILATVAAASCGGAASGFDATRARAHIDTLAGTIGSRPHGSPEATLARNYIVGQLESLGFTVRIQETEAVAPEQGLTAYVRNVIAWRDGDIDDAIALVSHYDTRPQAAGAQDDAMGVAISLEAARLLAEAPLRHSLFVVVTDAEEVGLMGARAVVTDPGVAQRVRAFLNFDGTGAAGPSMLFQSTGGAPLEAWASGAVAPFGGSFAIEIYKRMPNDTDFTILRTLGAGGLNFAAIGDNYAYHTDRDVPERVRTSTVRHATRNAVSTIIALDAMDLTASGATPTYFDLARSRGIVYGPVMTLAVSVIACVLGVLAWLPIATGGPRKRRLAAHAMTVLSACVVTLACIVGALGAASLVAVARAEVAPWYAAPAPYFVFILLSGVLGGWAAARLIALLPRKRRPNPPPVGVWFVTLPLWVALTAALQALAPSAAYLVALPLATASVALLASRGAVFGMRVASALALAVAAVLWLEPTSRLLLFLVALFGWLPLVPPLWIYPALIGAAALMLAPGLIGSVFGRGTDVARTSRVLLLLGVPWLGAGLLSLMTPAYTDHRPHRRAALYVQDDARGQARWEINGHEPGPGIDASPGISWGAVGSADAPGTRVTGLPGPFRFESASEPLVGQDALPAVVRTELVEQVNGGYELILTVVPRELTAIRLSLPPGLVPLESSLAGRVRAGRWEASYAALPAAGLTLRLGLGPLLPGDLRGAALLLSTPGLPGGTEPRRLPPWLPSEATSWAATSVFVIPIGP